MTRIEDVVAEEERRSHYNAAIGDILRQPTACRDCAAGDTPGDGLSAPGRLLLQHATIMIDSLVDHALIELDHAQEQDLPANPIVEMFNLLVGRPANDRDPYEPWDAYQLSLQLLIAAQWTPEQARVWMRCETCGGRGQRRPM